MKQLLVRALAVTALLGLLSACSEDAEPVRLSFTMQPSGNLGYEVDDQGQITIETRNLVFRNAPGAHGLQLTSYRIEFYDENDEPVLVGDNVQLGSLSVFVPPGLRCPAEDAAGNEIDPEFGCTLAVPGARFAPGPLVVTEGGYQLLPVGIAQAHLARGGFELGDDGSFATTPLPVGWHGDITFSGVTATGGAFTSPVYRVGIAPPN